MVRSVFIERVTQVASKTKTVEDEVLDLLDMSPKKGEDRQEFLEAVVEASNDLTDKQWNTLSEEAQDWINAAAKAFNAKKDIVDFPEDDEPAGDEADEVERPARTGRGRDAEDEAPRSGRGRSREAEEEEEAPRAGRGRSRDAEEEEAPRSRGRSRDAEEEEAPRGRSRGRGAEEEEAPRARGRSRDAEEEEAPRGGRGRSREAEEEEPAPRSGRGRSAAAEEPEADADEVAIPATTKKKIRTMIIEKPAITADAIMKALGEKSGVSKLVVSNIRTEFREGIKALQDAKLLKKALL
jgi:hypothetical protein